jgi:hypothetical protein
LLEDAVVVAVALAYAALLDELAVAYYLSSCKTQTAGVVVIGRIAVVGVAVVGGVGLLFVRSTPSLEACCQVGRPIHSLGMGFGAQSEGLRELQHSFWTSPSLFLTHTQTHALTHSLSLSC